MRSLTPAEQLFRRAQRVWSEPGTYAVVRAQGAAFARYQVIHVSDGRVGDVPGIVGYVHLDDEGALAELMKDCDDLKAMSDLPCEEVAGLLSLQTEGVAES